VVMNINDSPICIGNWFHVGFFFFFFFLMKKMFIGLPRFLRLPCYYLYPKA
jgi:hypothetical protein